MTARPASVPEPTIGATQSEPDFSLVLGGPLFQFFRRAHLSDDALSLVRRRLGVIVVVAWLPLLVISMLQGRATRGTAAVPFVADLELHVRFLVATPLLVLAELVVHRRMRPIVQLFHERGIVPTAEPPASTLPSSRRSACEIPSSPSSCSSPSSTASASRCSGATTSP